MTTITIDLGDDPFNNAEILRKLSGGREPFYVVRAQDVLGAGTIRYWANKAEERGVSASKVKNARTCANAMLNWHPRKLPD